MGAIVMDGVVVESNSSAAGAVVLEEHISKAEVFLREYQLKVKDLSEEQTAFSRGI